MESKQIFYPESRFGGFTDIDGTIVFYTRVNALIDPSYVILDVGCGRGAYAEDRVAQRRSLRILKGKARKVIGLDVDAAGEQNPFLDEFHRLEAERWPLETDSVDLVVCDSVLEHIPEPDRFFAEISRILREGGYLCMRTPNSWSYVAVLARLVPNRYHGKVLTKVQESRKEEDVFPTYYRCNSLGKLRAMLSRHGFEHTVYGYEAEPSYLAFSKIAYWLGVLHQRFAPRFLKPAIFVFARRARKQA